MKKKILAVFLSLCMAMSLLPVTALATDAGDTDAKAATELPAADENGVITLTKDVTLETERYSINTSVNTIDLNGHTLTAPISVSGNLTIKDGSENGKGKVTSTGNPTVLVDTTGNLTLDSGTIETTGEKTSTSAPGAIYNTGSITINDGTVTGVYGIRSGAQLNGNPLDNKVRLTINGGTVHGDDYGIYLFGRGITGNDVNTVNNSQVSLTITGGKVECNEGKAAIGTNASSGKYAGYTFEMTGGVVDGSETGTGLYLPAIGVNNIFGGTITGAQAIRIAAGELNITGGQIISTGNNTDDIIAGGTGGASGSLVIGKAGTGYVGDLVVNVSGGAKLVNKTEGGNPTAVFVTDKTMNDPSYDNVVIEVNIEDIEITGDILRVSDLTNDGEKEKAKGSTTSLNISNVTVNGDVENQSTNGNMLIDDSKVTGEVSNDKENATISINNSDVGSISGDNRNNIIFAGNSTVDEKPQEATGVAMVNGKIYSDLNAAITAAQDDDTITLLQNIDKMSELTTGTTSGSNISLLSITKDVTIDGNGYGITITMPDGATNRSQAISVGNEGQNITVTLDDVDLTINGNDTDTDKGDAIDVWATLDITNGSTVTMKGVANGFVMQGGENAKVNIEKSTVTANDINGNFSNGGEWAIKEGSTVNIKDCGTHGLSVEKLTVDNSNVTVDGAKWVGIYAREMSFTDGANVTVTNCATADGIGDTYKNKGAVQLKHVAGKTPKLTIDDSTLTLKDNGNAANGQQVIYVGEGTLNNTGTINADKVDMAGADEFNITLVNNGDKSFAVTTSKSYTLPNYPNQGNNHFQGWRDQDGKTYEGGAKVENITKDMTFTAVWSYIPPANPNYKITIGDTANGTVTADPAAAKAGATVTLTPVPDEGYALSTLTVTDRFGDAVKVTENADGTYTFTMPNGQVTVKATFVETEEPAPAMPFTDVHEGDWFYEEVLYAYENGLMNGVGDNRFAPNSATTRGMLVTILYRLEGEPAVTGEADFDDVGDTWYTDAVIWAAANDIVNGIGDNQFGPENTLTREQLVTMLYRYAQNKGYDVTASADLSGYPDADKIQSWAQEAMTWAVAEGIVEGMDGNLNPAGSATRAQIATILMRFCEGVAK